MNMIAHKPRSLPLTVALIAIAQHCSHALAYDTVTHAAMTAKAFEKSALNPQSQSSLLTHLC